MENININSNSNSIESRFPSTHCSAAFKVAKSNKWIKAMTIAKVQYYAFFKEQEYKKFLVLAERQYWNVKALTLDDSGNIVRKVRIWIEQAEII